MGGSCNPERTAIALSLDVPNRGHAHYHAYGHNAHISWHSILTHEYK